jgi:osmotically-inducible protein OsmY
MRARTAFPRQALIALLAAAALGAAGREGATAPPERPRNIAGPGDYALREKLIGLFTRDPETAREPYRLILVNGGAVFSGEVSSCAVKTKMLRTAASIRGIINVTDEMRVARAELDDAALRKAVLGRLEESGEALGLQDLRVRLEDGEATLEGTVSRFEERVRAEEIAGSILGVTRVINRLRPRDAPSGGDDRSLVKAVIAYLEVERLFPYPARVNVRADGGVVTLTGVAGLCIARLQAGAMASLVHGVTRIENRIKVDPALERMRPMIRDLM